MLPQSYEEAAPTFRWASEQPMIDHELIERCRRGDRKAQQEIYARTAERVYRVLLRITHSSEDALDLAQETYVRAFTRIAQFDGNSSFYTWLCRIAVNEALQFLRREGVARTNRESFAARYGRGDPDNGADTRIDIEAALAQIPALERTMLVLRYQEGLDYQSIAQVADCSPGTVGSRLNRARGKMRELLKKGYGFVEETPAPKHPIDGVESESMDGNPTTSSPRVRPGTGT
jgi:RNA polymerase sigma-70 factor (ECF subfamily)